MRGGEACDVTRETARAVVRNGLSRLVVRVVTSTTPKPAVAVACASAQRELLDVADHLEITSRRSGRNGIVINRIRFFQALSRNEVAEFFPGIGDPRRSKQMALFANAVARAAFQFRRVNNRPR